MSDLSARSAGASARPLIGGSTFLVLTGIFLGWARGLTGLSNHSTRLALLLGIITVVMLGLMYLFSWRHNAGGGRKLSSALLGTVLGVILVFVSGAFLTRAAARIIVLLGPPG